LEAVLQLEAVACKDWLTNKVDRSVTGRVAKQQTTGAIQLPLNNVAVMAIDFTGTKGIATSIGHAPVAALANPEAGSRLAIAEALTNLVWAPIEGRHEGNFLERQLDVAGQKRREKMTGFIERLRR
jgi:phosphoribosylformylglycinamidine synthase